MNINVLFAVFRRNFVSYFAIPTGYVFICLFVLLGAIAAFWVPAFFSKNLANLDQLSFWLPFIMLVYVPSITMGVWADERKQGTDELLLTIPAGDFEIVLGKYLAAAAIFTVALLFSLLCNLAVLEWLGNPDVGLFVGTYVGYWLVGLAMLSIGMVASFLTSNITISFVLGMLLNLPLVFLAWAGAILGGLQRQQIMAVKSWSIGNRLDDFSHGVLSLSGVAYFLMIVVVMLYLSMVLIGRRHWFSGRRRWALAVHYLVRTLALMVVAVGAVVFFRHHDLRLDATSEQLSSLSRQTRELLRNLKVDRPVRIEAFVSPSVPEAYMNTRLNLLSVLQELEATGGDKLKVIIHNTERFSKEATLAEELYGIEPRKVPTFNRGEMGSEDIFLNVAVRCGLQKVPPLFINRGVPVEYELIRSICTVCQEQRMKLGVLDTDAKLFGGFNMQTMSATPNSPLIGELEKQYDVVRVSPAKPITEKYDVLLAVQPSSLGPEEMDNFIAAVADGQPTAIFEDPAPLFTPGVPATGAPRQPPGGMNPMFGRMQSPPKGDIRKLWELLGVDFSANRIVWQDYNPYPRFTSFNDEKEFVFVDPDCTKTPFGDNPISSGLQQVLCPFPGFIDKRNTSEMKFTPLVKTGEETGDLRYNELMQMTPRGPQMRASRPRYLSGKSYVLAARIQGKTEFASAPGALGKENGGESTGDKKPEEATIDVVLVADMDLFSPPVFQLREQGDMPEIDVYFKFDNVPFVLNVLDELAGDQRFIAIRKRRPAHRTLVLIDERTKEARKEVAEARKKFTDEYDELKNQEEEAMQDKLAELKQRKNIDTQQMLIELGMMQQNLERRKEAKLEQARRKMDREINNSEVNLNLEVKRVQDQYKLWAVLLPPIPPLLVAVIVFFSRRAREREGVSRSRLR